ncbi:hypothetical protein Csa_007978 [Cucumis sativus]|nr:hypothetical protein Csa_007978 [Cucumis sativus]
MLWSPVKQAMRLCRWPTASFLPASNGLIYTMDMKNGENSTLRITALGGLAVSNGCFLFKASIQNCFVDVPFCLE